MFFLALNPCAIATAGVIRMFTFAGIIVDVVVVSNMDRWIEIKWRKREGRDWPLLLFHANNWQSFCTQMMKRHDEYEWNKLRLFNEQTLAVDGFTSIASAKGI